MAGLRLGNTLRRRWTAAGFRLGDALRSRRPLIVHARTLFREKLVGKQLPSEMRDALPVVVVDVIAIAPKQEKVVGAIVRSIPIFVMNPLISR